MLSDGSAGVVELGKLARGETGRCKRSPLEVDGRALTFDFLVTGMVAASATRRIGSCNYLSTER